MIKYNILAILSVLVLGQQFAFACLPDQNPGNIPRCEIVLTERSLPELSRSENIYGCKLRVGVGDDTAKIVEILRPGYALDYAQNECQRKLKELVDQGKCLKFN